MTADDERDRTTFLAGLLRELPAAFKVRVVDSKHPSDCSLSLNCGAARTDLVPELAYLAARWLVCHLPSDTKAVDLHVEVTPSDIIDFNVRVHRTPEVT